MAEPTVDRVTLRRTIGLQMGMRFYRYQQQRALTGRAGNVLYDTGFLMQPDDYWNRSWCYMVDGASLGDARMIIDSIEAERSMQLEFAPSGATASGDKYELLDYYSPQTVHEAINAAIRDGWPAFFSTLEDTQFCLGRDRMEVDISGLNAWLVAQVWIERPSAISRYDVSAGTTTQCTLNTTDDLSAVNTDWVITFYDGKGRGHARQIATFSNVTKIATWTTALATAPDATSKVSLFNASDKDIDWYPAHATSFDRKAWPNKMRFKAPYDEYLPGNRLRIVYTTLPAELTTDASTCVIPREFLIARARAYLYDWHKDDTRVDRQRFDQNFNEQMQIAELLRKSKAFAPPDDLFWTEGDPALQHGMYMDPMGDPLGWQSF